MHKYNLKSYLKHSSKLRMATIMCVLFSVFVALQISGSNAELCCTKEELAKLQQELQEQQEGRSALQDKLSVSD